MRNKTYPPIHLIFWSFDNIFIECDIARGMIYRGKQSNVIHNWAMTVDPVYIYMERFAGGNNWYMKE